MSSLSDSYWLVGSTCCLRIGVHMHVLLDSWRLRLGCLERLGDDLWMRVTLLVQRLCRYIHKCLAQLAHILELQSESDHRRQKEITEMLAGTTRGRRNHQTQMAEFQRQQGPAEGPAQPDAPEEAGSSS
ncbi:hypothetical protein Tco_0604855 [Tanacetum coccineum]